MSDRTEHSEHIDFEVLNDYVDGRLDAMAIALIDKHLAGCADCSGELASLRALVSATASLPRSVLPTEDIWADLEARINERKGAVLRSAAPGGSIAPAGAERQPTQWRNRAWLAAAAVVLMVLSSAVTAIVLRRASGTDIAHESPDSIVTVPVRDPAPVLPASFRVAEGHYTETIEVLRLAVDAQRANLSPETIRTVDRSLAVVDSAIAEARAALLADPSNRTLVDLLSASYQRKLDLLRRTSELGSRT
jgi:hypothetical protein